MKYVKETNKDDSMFRSKAYLHSENANNCPKEHLLELTTYSEKSKCRISTNEIPYMLFLKRFERNLFIL